MPNISKKDTIEEYVEYLKRFRKKNGEKLMESTINRYTEHISKYFDEFQSIQDLDHIVNKMNMILNRRKSIVIYASFISYLGFLGVDTFAREGIHKKVNTPRKTASALTSIRYLQSNTYTREEMRKLILECDDKKLQLIISMLYDTAARREELLNIKFGDIHFMDPKIPHERAEIDGGIYARINLLGKGGKRRIVYLSLTSVKILRNLYGEIYDDDSYVIHYYYDDGKPYEKQGDKLYKDFKKYTKRILGKESHPHNCRHTKATHLANKRMDAMAIKSYLGHTSIVTTQIYVEVSEALSHDAYKQYSYDINDFAGDIA